MTPIVNDVECACMGKEIALLIRAYSKYAEEYSFEYEKNAVALQNDTVLFTDLLGRLFGEYMNKMQPIAEELANRLLCEREGKEKATA